MENPLIVSALPDFLSDLSVGGSHRFPWLAGIGSYYAKMIIRYRDRLGGFAAAEQLNEIEGIPESALAFIHIDANHIHKLDINKLNLNQLAVSYLRMVLSL